LAIKEAKGGIGRDNRQRWGQKHFTFHAMPEEKRER
jgi:hypothetical protein